MSGDPCAVLSCKREGIEEVIDKRLCPEHAEECEKARGGDSWMQAFIDAGPDANEEDVAANWLAQWCADQA